MWKEYFSLFSPKKYIYATSEKADTNKKSERKRDRKLCSAYRCHNNARGLRRCDGARRRTTDMVAVRWVKVDGI
jgi:hypothetical protein